MKTIQSITIQIFSAILFMCIGYVICLNSECKSIPEAITSPVKPDTVDTVIMVSKVIEVDPLDYSKRPSYSKPETYKIIHINDYYMVQLSGGMMWNDQYETAKEAQKEINKAADRSFERWIKSGGLDW